MGISNPNVGYSGVAASDDTLSIVTAERGTSSPTWVMLYRGLWLADVTEGATIRLKADMKITPNVVIGEMMWMVDDAYIWADSTVSLAYESKTDDVTVAWKRKAEIKIYGQVQATSVVKLKNIEIAGTVSPACVWLA